jgi:2-keto-4-pentenoate hydratase
MVPPDGGYAIQESWSMKRAIPDMKPRKAAECLLIPWRLHTRIAGIAPDVRPSTRSEGYRVQAALAELTGDRGIGWKIAATSVAGQKHIGVSGPLAGRLLESRRKANGASVSIGSNIMKVAEAEFAFRMGRDLPPRETSYSVEEVLAASAALYPAIEFPYSRYDDFVRAGEAQLIADFACAGWMILGPPASESWRSVDLAVHKVTAWIDGQKAADGIGSNVLDDPRIALSWIANELSREGMGLKSEDLVITGTCVAPVSISAGQHFVADFGTLGKVSARLTDGGNAAERIRSFH